MSLTETISGYRPVQTISALRNADGTFYQRPNAPARRNEQTGLLSEQELRSFLSTDLPELRDHPDFVSALADHLAAVLGAANGEAPRASQRHSRRKVHLDT